MEVYQIESKDKKDLKESTSEAEVEVVRPRRRYIEPRPRPRVTTGKTIETRVGCGTLYITINEDEEGIAEVFLRLGKSGGCSASQTEAIGKLISLALRCNINPEEIIRKLKGIRCPYTIWNDGEAVTSCADAIAKTLERYLRGDFDKIKTGAEKSQTLNNFFETNSKPSSTHEKTQKEGDTSGEAVLALCPECGSKMYPSEGCYICHSCGFSKCG